MRQTAVGHIVILLARARIGINESTRLTWRTTAKTTSQNSNHVNNKKLYRFDHC